MPNADEDFNVDSEEEVVRIILVFFSRFFSTMCSYSSLFRKFHLMDHALVVPFVFMVLWTLIIYN